MKRKFKPYASKQGEKIGKYENDLTLPGPRDSTQRTKIYMILFKSRNLVI